MRKLLTVFFDTIFPPTTTERLLRDIPLSSIKKLYSPGTHANIEYIFRYQESLIKAAITENKFNHHKLAAKLLAQGLPFWLGERAAETLFIPIPLGKRRFLERGHNQVESILRACDIPLQIDSRILERIIETVPQTKLSKEQRLQNMKQAFQCNEVIDLGKTITQVVLVDDVVTTGATLAAARAKLAPHIPPNITLRCLAIAH